MSLNNPMKTNSLLKKMPHAVSQKINGIWYELCKKCACVQHGKPHVFILGYFV
jgi:hypothetical protein